MADNDISDDEERVTRIYERYAPDVAAYVVRRAPTTDAADAVAEAFLVVWRRRATVPDEPLTLPWLYGVARRVLANQRRSTQRRSRLADRLADQFPVHVLDGAAVEQRDELTRVTNAIGTLSDADAELLRLAAWEALSPAEIAAVLDIDPEQARRRLYRARQRLRRELERPPTTEPRRRSRTSARSDRLANGGAGSDTVLRFAPMGGFTR